MASPNGTVVTANTGGAITDSKGNVWTISASGLVVENGVADTFTANVTELAFKNGVLWQENTSFLWYAKVGNVPGSYHGWSPATSVAPVPVTRQWVGGGNNSAGNPNDWNDHGVPQVGDSLTMSSGTMNVTGHQLMGVTIRAPTSATVTINVTGVTPMVLASGNGGLGGANVTVNLAANSEWIGGFSGYPGTAYSIKGAGQLDNDQVSSVDGTVTVGVNVVGTGSISVSATHSLGKLEFMHSVSAGQHVTISGDEAYGLQFGTLQIDSPLNYHASTTIGFGEIILEGLKATSYSFKNDILSVFNGNTVIDTLKLALSAPQTTGPLPEFGAPSAPANFGVSRVGGSVVIHADGPKYADGGTLLPVHA
jgi:hypothetical protein